MLSPNTLWRYLRALRALPVGRAHFKNGLVATMKYFLWREGLLKLKILEVKCRDDSSLVLPPKLYGLLLSGLLDGLFKGVRGKEGAVAAKGFTIPIQELSTSEVALQALKRGWRYDEGHRCWFRGDVKFKHMRYYVLEVFDHEEHKYVEVDGRLVVDIGAGYGETAIYFLRRGARQVIAVEPCPKVFKEMVENLRLN